MKWYSVELDQNNADKLKAFLRAEEIYFEPSSCYNLIHFEIRMDREKEKKVEDFLDTL